MNQKTVKLIRKFVKKNFADKPADKQRQIYQRFKATYYSQNDAGRNKIKTEMRAALELAAAN